LRALRIAAATVLSVVFLDASPVPSQQTAAGEVLTNETVIKLVKAGLGDKEAGVSDNIIAAIVSKSSTSAQPLPSATSDIRTPANARKLTVLTVSHSRSERDFTVTTPQTTNTNCDLYPNSVNCRSTTYGGGSENRAVYRFVEVVTSNESGKVTQYTLARTARWVWNSTDWLNDGESFPAEIKGKQMFITCRRGGNQGKKEILKYDIVDIRPTP
jgi:hypothetical protein